MMSSPEMSKYVGFALLGIAIFAHLMWVAITMGFWPDLRDKEAGSAWEMHKKYSPLWWRRFSPWLLGAAFVLGVVGYLLSEPYLSRSIVHHCGSSCLAETNEG
jgi:hypothetical protein